MRSPEISQDALPRGAFEPECGVASQPRFADVEQSRTFEFRGRSQPAVNGGHVDGKQTNLGIQICVFLHIMAYYGSCDFKPTHTVLR